MIEENSQKKYKSLSVLTYVKFDYILLKDDNIVSIIIQIQTNKLQTT